MNKKLIKIILLSIFGGFLITSLTFFLVKGSCINTTIDMPGVVSNYESKNCKNSIGINDKIYGYPLPFIKIGPRCSGFICPMDMYSKEKIMTVLPNNLLLDLTLWSVMSFTLISIFKLVKKKNAK